MAIQWETAVKMKELYFLNIDTSSSGERMGIFTYDI